ncbi:hypothetical protein Kpol_1009p13 [Vanderwaltozyma polyspora DSM 70294]|uniref:Glutathione hydrolase n=1 Tax=Vanderwaltozyma polyspora (strain ATCC 22028 / DSM 70294 / BCRC 21397 / CBS 2163 / NBRC 10782 / NRRL Y-8283 / UCD 57-17) TaxID=436907 RepID=A7TPD9_VANPO|nr:uncharacterized protein Kpol_1009p13 [Vanderwaltozyma polyspora DSM 70294]EDO15867.1 hypothetical protein Kpol_1009p13 [Vanderwaltozyma polyspora DSM 70294]
MPLKKNYTRRSLNRSFLIMVPVVILLTLFKLHSVFASILALEDPLFLADLVKDPELFVKHISGGNDHNIDIGDLNRSPTLTPDQKLLKKGFHGAISSDLELCNNLTVNSVLKKFPQANAADASVTLGLCIGMVNFFNSGIGGGGYAVFSGKNESDHLFVDFREKAPINAHKDMFENCTMCSKVGGLAIAVPGELMGLYHLFESRGSGNVTWYDLVEPVATLGYKGWEVEETLAFALRFYEPIFLKLSSTWEFVLNENKTGVKRRGDWISRPIFANLLMELAHNGSVAPFYDPNHWMAKSMVNTIQNNGGIISLQDFESYNINSSLPLSMKIRKGFMNAPNNDLTILTSSGSSSGAALLSALSIMDNYPSVKGGDYGTETTFELVEAMKWMASARSRLGDYNGPDLPPRIKEVLDQSWTSNAINNIRINSTDHGYKTLENWTLYNPAYEMNEPHGTAHFSIVDHHNNAVSLTTTINLLFGSLVYDKNTGVIFNNEMDDFSQNHRSNSFSLAASKYNFPEPGKRPLSSTSPSIILNEIGFPDLIVGASGGSRITTSTLQTIIRTYWYNMPLLEAIAYPRVHHQLLPYQLELESFNLVGRETVKQLENMGHDVVEEIPKSVVNAIRFVEGEWHAVSDFWRKRGISIAY